MQFFKYVIIIALLSSALFITRRYGAFVDFRIEYTRAFLKFLRLTVNASVRNIPMEAILSFLFRAAARRVNTVFRSNGRMALRRER